MKLIEELVREIREMPNRDDKVRAQLLIADGGGISKFKTIDKLDELKQKLEGEQKCLK